MDGGIPKNLEVGGGYDFRVILGYRQRGRFWGFFVFDDLPHDNLIQIGAVISNVSKFKSFLSLD